MLPRFGLPIITAVLMRGNDNFGGFLSDLHLAMLQILCPFVAIANKSTLNSYFKTPTAFYRTLRFLTKKDLSSFFISLSVSG